MSLFAREPRIEAALLERRDDVREWAVYADWLEANGSDGECTGSVIGAISSGRVRWTRPISAPVKIEGLAHHEGDAWFLVADADDPDVKAPLFRARL